MRAWWPRSGRNRLPLTSAAATGRSRLRSRGAWGTSSERRSRRGPRTPTATTSRRTLRDWWTGATGRRPSWTRERGTTPPSTTIDRGSLWSGDRAMREVLLLAADRVGHERDRGAIARAPPFVWISEHGDLEHGSVPVDPDTREERVCERRPHGEPGSVGCRAVRVRPGVEPQRVPLLFGQP